MEGFFIFFVSVRCFRITIDAPRTRHASLPLSPLAARRYEAALQAVLTARGLPDTPQTRAEQGELEASVGPYHAFASVLGAGHPAVQAFADVAGALQAKHRGKERKYPVDSGSGLPLSRPYAAPAPSDPERAARMASQVGAGSIPSAHSGHAHTVGAPTPSPAPSARADSGAGHGPDAYLEALRAAVRLLLAPFGTASLRVAACAA
jgi:hypothetical protein